MPYSDNLYSMMDDDEEDELTQQPQWESNGQYGDAQTRHEIPAAGPGGRDVNGEDDEEDDADVLSPSDGYFNNRSDVLSDAPAAAAATTSFSVPRVPNVLVQDPSLPPGSTAESKAREAEEERRRNSNRPSTPSGTSSTGYPRDDAGPPFHPTQTSSNGSPPGSHASLHSQQPSIVPPSQSGRAAYYQPSQSSSSSSSNHTPSVRGSISYTSYAPQRAAYYNERLRFPPQEDPPAYTPSQSTTDTVRNYRTFSPAVPVVPEANNNNTNNTNTNMGRWDQTQGLLGRGPESMRDPHRRYDDEGGSGWWHRIRRWVPFINGEGWRSSLLSTVVLLMTAGLLISLMSDGKHNNPNAPRPPSMEYPDVDKSISWPSKSFCKDGRIARDTQTYDLSFKSDKPLSIIQNVIDNGHTGYRQVHVQGEVIFRRTGKDTPGPSVVLEIVVNDERVQVPTDWDSETQALRIKVPGRIYWEDNHAGPCIGIKATVWVPEDSSLDFVEVNTIFLGIKLLDNLSLSVSKNTKLTSTVGTISAASAGSESRDSKIIDVGSPDSFHFSSRYIEVKTTAADILGAWPLFDYLSLQSTSGDVKVCIEPKEDADKDSPKPAILYIKSNSGDVEFREPIHAAEQAHKISQALLETGAGYVSDLKAEHVLPPRDYRVEVHTASGRIKGAVAFSSSAGFRSTSGAVSLELLPILPAGVEREVRLTTGSTSGDTNVEVLEPLWIDPEMRYLLPVTPNGPIETIEEGERNGDNDGWEVGTWGARTQLVGQALRNLNGAHSSTSADIRIKYPASWEGDINMSTLSGSLKVGGEGVRIIKHESDWPGVNKKLIARKGEEGKGGLVKLSTTSGDCEVLVGNK